MNKEFLDKIEKGENHSSRYSILSFSLSIVTLLILIYVGAFVSAKTIGEDDFAIPSMELTSILITTSALGLIFAVLSTREQESKSWMKWVGGVANLVLFIIILSSIFFKFS